MDKEEHAADLKIFKTKICKVGNSGVVTLTVEILAAPDAKEGDTLYLIHSDDNDVIKLQLHYPELPALKAAEDVIYENRTLLQALA